MTYAQVYNFYKDKRDCECKFTNELIEKGFCQRQNGYIAVAIISGLTAPPSQWWHLMQYCLGKYEKHEESRNYKYTPCGELIFWMAEATLKTSNLFSEKELEELKDEVLNIGVLDRRTANKKIKDACWDKIVKIVEDE